MPELDEFPVDGRDEEFFETYPSGIFSNIEVSPATLPNGTVGTNYAQQLTATGGTAPYVFSLMGGAFPAGISLLGDTLAGTPSAAGSSSFSIQVVDANGHVAVVPFTLVVDAE